MEQKLELLWETLNKEQKEIFIKALNLMQEKSTTNGTADHIGCWLSVIDK